LKAYDVAYFMASTDDAQTNRKFAEANSADFPILSDPEKSAAAAYGVLSSQGFASRWTYYIDRDGKIAFVDKRVKPLSAGADIAARLEKLGIPKR
jgi:thioredoxin-dependent peroxiredoxin